MLVLTAFAFVIAPALLVFAMLVAPILAVASSRPSLTPKASAQSGRGQQYQNQESFHL
jgi:uncharacterized protein YraI